MNTYVLLGKYTHEAVNAIGPQRTKEVVSIIEKCGGKVTGAYALLGQYDLALIVNLPDLNDAIKTSVAAHKATGINFTTAAAVPVEEFDRICRA